MDPVISSLQLNLISFMEELGGKMYATLKREGDQLVFDTIGGPSPISLNFWVK